MGTIWREYGVIAVLLVVSVGGYLYLSGRQQDLVQTMMDSLSERLLAMVSDPAARDSTSATLSELKMDVANREVSSQQLEKLAANVLNLEASGGQLDHQEATLLIDLALDDRNTLDAGDGGRDSGPPPDGRRTSRTDLARTALRVERAMALYSEIRQASSGDSAAYEAPPVRFYSDSGLRAVIDERLRPALPERDRATATGENTFIAWQSRLTESVRADRRKRRSEAETLRHLALVHSGDRSVSRDVQLLANLRDLESRGLVGAGSTDSLSLLLERQIGVMIDRDLETALQEAAADLRMKRIAQVRLDSAAATVIIPPPIPPRSSNLP